jgi:predicted cation transporter
MIIALEAIVQLPASIRHETRNLVAAALAVGACAALAPCCLPERGSALRHCQIVAGHNAIF